jgi:MOSC domain-containing protein YiiM
LMAGSTPRLVAVSIVHRVRRGPDRHTAIDKRPVGDVIEVRELGLVGDRQCDTTSHGGRDRALYAYAAEDAAWWSAQLGREITPGLLGENLTTAGLNVSGALIGERWRLGSGRSGVLVEVRLPRIPCSNLSAHIGIPKFHNRFAAARRTGAYLAVLSPGWIRSGDPIVIEHRPDHNVTVADTFYRPDPEKMQRLLDARLNLADELRARARRTVVRSRERDHRTRAGPSSG